MDDLNISHPLTRNWEIKNVIEEMIEKKGYLINKKKSKWFGKGNNDAKIVAGVSIESITRRQIKRLVRSKIYNCLKTDQELDTVTKGYLAYIKSIDSDYYTYLKDYCQNLKTNVSECGPIGIEICLLTTAFFKLTPRRIWRLGYRFSIARSTV